MAKSKTSAPRASRDEPALSGASDDDDSARALRSRQAAASILRNVLDRRLAFDEALTLAMRSQSVLADRDRGLARTMAFVALKHWGAIRFLSNKLLSRPLDGTPPDVVAAIAIGAAQILYMAVPDHAAVDAAVTLVKRQTRSEALAGVVNAVLRRMARERETLLATLDPVISLPHWLTVRWRAAYGEERTRAMARMLALEPALDLTILRPGDRTMADWAGHLGGSALPNGSLRLDTHESVHTLPGYDEGTWIVQDAAASLPAHLLAARPGEVIYDLCAAPGGKTAQLAATGATVTALDRSAPRLARLRDNMERLGLTVAVVTADAAQWSAEPADAVLLDAPCSGTGTIRRHPDIAWTKSLADLKSLTALQARLFDNAARLVRPGGRLVYSTCSLEPEEGEHQTRAFLARHTDFAIAPVTPSEMPNLEMAIDPDGALRTTPEMWPHDNPRRAGLDGFYAVRLVRHA